MIKDIHTHHAVPQPEGVVSVSPMDFSPVGGQLYSVGVHPWSVPEGVTEEMWQALETAVVSPQVVAIGECGIDLLKGGPLFRQMLVLKRQIELSERVGKPLLLHCVKAHDIIIGVKKDMEPKQPWLVHGFRGKPTVAKMLTDAGIYLSFGERFNEDTLSALPEEMIFAETDESSLSIEEVIAHLSEVKGKDLTSAIETNCARFLHL